MPTLAPFVGFFRKLYLLRNVCSKINIIFKYEITNSQENILYVNVSTWEFFAFEVKNEKTDGRIGFCDF